MKLSKPEVVIVLLMIAGIYLAIYTAPTTIRQTERQIEGHTLLVTSYPKDWGLVGEKIVMILLIGTGLIFTIRAAKK